MYYFSCGSSDFDSHAELLKEVELKRFMAQLKKELISSGGATSEHDGKFKSALSLWS